MLADSSKRFGWNLPGLRSGRRKVNVAGSAVNAARMQPIRDGVLLMARLTLTVAATCALTASSGARLSQRLWLEGDTTRAMAVTRQGRSDGMLALSLSAARKMNAERSFAPRAIEIAFPYVLLPTESNAEEWSAAIRCMALANYYEAGSEGMGGMRAVSQVILNRLRHPAFPKTVCGVVFQGSDRSSGCQFTFTCDGAMGRQPASEVWQRAREVAVAALAGHVEARVGMATHYHANWVVPYWASTMDKMQIIGSHIFYVFKGKAGSRSAFSAPEAATGRLLAQTNEPAGLAAQGRMQPEVPAGHATGAASTGLRPLQVLNVRLLADETRGRLWADEAVGQPLRPRSSRADVAGVPDDAN